MFPGFFGLIAMVTSAGLIASGSETLTTRCANTCEDKEIRTSTNELRSSIIFKCAIDSHGKLATASGWFVTAGLPLSGLFVDGFPLGPLSSGHESFSNSKCRRSEESVIGLDHNCFRRRRSYYCARR